MCFRVDNLETLLSKSKTSVNAQHFGVRISVKKLLFKYCVAIKQNTIELEIHARSCMLWEVCITEAMAE